VIPFRWSRRDDRARVNGTFGTRWRAFWDGPAWPMRTYLLLALALRVPAVLFADGYAFPDQQYQNVDPAWHLATGGAWHRTWEWIDGIRSQVYPAALGGLFRGALAAGIDEPRALLTVARGAHAVVSLLPLWTFWLLVVRWRPIATPRASLVLLAVTGLMVQCVQPNGAALATLLVLTCGIALAGPTRFAALGGFCLGLAFCCRFQDALFGPGFLGVLLAQRRWRAAFAFALACCPGIVLQGVADVTAGGPFLGTPWRYLTSNLGLGAAAKWQTQPALFYVYAGVLPVLCLVPPCLGAAVARVRAGAAVLPAACAGAFVHLAVHSFVARKALRFELGAVVLLVAVLAVGLHSRRSLVHSAALWVVHGGLWLWASLWVGDAGATAMADWLRREPSFAAGAPVAVVGGDATALGGCFRARPPRVAVLTVERENVLAWLRDPAAEHVTLVVTAREPLSPEAVAAGALELAAEFRGCLDLRRGERRFVYRRRA
jgi:hypothetical protein